MARNFRYDKAIDSVAVPIDPELESGAPVAVGPIRGVVIARATEHTGGLGTVKLDGSTDQEVSGETTAGQSIVYLDEDGSLTTSDGTAWGYALESKGSGTGTCHVAHFGILLSGGGGEPGGPSQSEWDDLVSRVEALESASA